MTYLFNDRHARNIVTLLQELTKSTGGAYSGSLRFMKVLNPTNKTESNDDAIINSIHETLDKYIFPPSIFFQKTPDTFVIVFLQKDPVAIEHITRKIRRDMLEQLETQHGVTHFQIALEIKEITHDMLMNETGGGIFSNPSSFEHDNRLGAEVPSAGDSGPESDIDICFRPVWQASKSVIANYTTTLRRINVGGKVDYGYSVLPRSNDLEHVATVDLMMLRASRRALEYGIKARRSFAVITPVDYRTLAKTGISNAYLTELKNIPPKAAGRICIEIVGMTSAMVDKNAIGTLAALSAVCRQLLLHLPISAEGFEHLKSVQFTAIGTSAFKLPKDPAAYKSQLKYFVAAMLKFRKPLYLTGLTDRSMAQTAENIGFDYLAGPLIGPDLPQPMGARMVQLQHLDAAAMAADN